MGFRSSIRGWWESVKTPKPVKLNSIYDKLQTVEGRPNDYIFNGYYIEVGCPQSTAINGSGIWLYAIYEYSEERGKGKRLGWWGVDVENGDREFAIAVACNRVDLLILRGEGLLGERNEFIAWD